MKKLASILLFVPVLFFAQKEAWDYIGNSRFDKKTDRKDFYLCDENHIFQYFNNSEGVEYEGENPAIEAAFTRQYNPENVRKDNGWIRIRFVVNCKGETDRFRVLTADYQYKAYAFDPKIISQLIDISKSLKGWKPKTINNRPIDYYQYLIFKIKDGKIDEILP